MHPRISPSETRWFMICRWETGAWRNYSQKVLAFGWRWPYLTTPATPPLLQQITCLVLHNPMTFQEVIQVIINASYNAPSSCIAVATKNRGWGNLMPTSAGDWSPETFQNQALPEAKHPEADNPIPEPQKQQNPSIPRNVPLFSSPRLHLMPRNQVWHGCWARRMLWKSWCWPPTWQPPANGSRLKTHGRNPKIMVTGRWKLFQTVGFEDSQEAQRRVGLVLRLSEHPNGWHQPKLWIWRSEISQVQDLILWQRNSLQWVMSCFELKRCGGRRSI